MSNSTTSRIDFLLAARDQASPAMRNVQTAMGGLDRAAGVLAGGLSAIAVGAGIQGLQALAEAFTEVARRGAVFEQLGSVLDDFAASVGSSSDAMIAAAKKASMGTISEYELILNANRAIQFEVAKTPEQFAKLIELSTALGRAQGIADTQALEYITTGLARESRLILDNLGLIIDIDKATQSYAATLGKSATELTQAERKTALLNEAYIQGAAALKANREASDSAATNFERMDAAIQNSKDALGALFAPAVAVVAQNIATAAEAAAEGIRAVAAAGSEASALDLRSLVPQMEAGRERLQERIATARSNGDIQLAIDLTAQLAALERQLAEAKQRYFDVLRQVYPAQESDAAARNRTSVAAEGQMRIEMMAAAAAREHAAALGPLNYSMGASVVEGEALNNVLAGAPAWMQATARAALAAGASFIDVANDVAVLKGQLASLEGAAAGARSAIIREAAGVAGIVGDNRAVELAGQQIGKLNFGVAALEQRLKSGSITQTEFDFQLAKLNNTVTDVFGNIREADAQAQRFASQGLRAAEQAAGAAEQAFDNLKGKVAGVLSAALDPGVGVDPDQILEDMGLRPDAINENARRLADVAVKGFDSPWFDYFRREFPDLFEQSFANATSPDGVKAAAASLLKNFQDGLNPELIDKDTAKERVRRMLIGEAKMEELATQIAQELAAEMGNVSIGQAGAAARIALGLDDGATIKPTIDTEAAAAQYAALGASAAQAFAGGAAGQQAAGGPGFLPAPPVDTVVEQYGGLARTAFDAFAESARVYVEEANLGLELTGVLATQLTAGAALEQIRSAGQVQGATWATSFKANIGDIPDYIIDLIALKVVPRVEAAQNQQAQTTGAR